MNMIQDFNSLITAKWFWAAHSVRIFTASIVIIGHFAACSERIASGLVVGAYEILKGENNMLN